jgi:hypothetical protein
LWRKISGEGRHIEDLLTGEQTRSVNEETKLAAVSKRDELLQEPGSKVCVQSTINRWPWIEIYSVKTRFSLILFIAIIENCALHTRALAQ